MNKQLTIKEINTRLKGIQSATDPFLQSLASDGRKGVQNAVKRCLRRLERLKQAQQAFHQAFHHRFLYENALWQSGNQYVAGIDEGSGSGTACRARCRLCGRPRFVF